MSQWLQLKQRAEGKWQVPLFGLSLVLLGAALLRLRPATGDLTPEETFEFIDKLIAEGFHGRAIEYTEMFAAREDRSEADLARAHLRLARARHGDAAQRRIRSERLGREIVDSYHRARRYGLVLTGTDFERLGEAFEWRDRTKRAVSCYEQAIDLGADQPSELRRRIVRLLQRQPEASPDRINEILDALLAEVGPDRLDLRIWAIEEKVHTLQELDRLSEAATLLVREKKRFERSDLQNHFEFIENLYLYLSGRFDEAEHALRALRNRLERHDEVHAMTGWLLGRVVLHDQEPGRPREALSFFEDVMAYHPKSLYAAASRIGAGESLVALERHAEAVDAYRIAMAALDRFPGQHLVNRSVLRGSLAVASEAQRQAGHLQAAVAYAGLATELIDPGDSEQSAVFLQQLVQAQAEYADDLQHRADSHREQGDVEEASALASQASEVYRVAGETSLRLAKVNTLTTRRSAEWSWRAAEFTARAGDNEQAIKRYRTFTAEHPGHSLVPRALLRIGKHHQAMGGPAEAVAAFQELYRDYPRTLEGSQALVPLARCYLAMGPEYETLAEKTLRVVLEESEIVTPEAPEFAEAQFLLGEVLVRRKQYELAVAALEEAAERYPNDPRFWRSRFLLADAYRASALALKEEATEADLPSELQRMQEESRSRFDRARELYGSLITEYEVRGVANVNRLERLYLRHAMFYEADCFFETGQYEAALRHYEEAASTYRDSTSALSAYVQIINCYVFLGEPQEARASLARALIVADSISQAAFDASVSPESREDWKRYFDWLGASGLF